MGRLVDYNDVYNAIQITTDNFGVAKSVVEDNMLTMLSKIDTVEAIPKADYEARLKADMVAMLEELNSEIRKLHIRQEDEDQLYVGLNIGVTRCSNLIQEKINVLKGV